MKALVFEEPRKAVVKQVEDPEPGAGEVLVKVAACGVCGTDVHMYLDEWEAPFPLIPGHEFSGTIAALGDGVDDIAIGQPVSVLPCEYCGRCRFCHSSQFNFCEDLLVYGSTLPGAFAEYVSVKRETVYPCDGVSLEEAAVIEPVSCGVHAFKQLNYSLGSRVLLFGCGSQGLILLQLSRLHGASSVTAVDLFDKKLVLAEKLGADEVLKADENLDGLLQESGPFDLVIDATGNPNVVAGLFKHVDKGGQLLFFGVCPPDARIEVNPFDVFRRELKIYGSFSLSGDFEDALQLVKSGVIDVGSLITHRLPLEDFTTALELMQNPVESVKILIEPEL
jgi:2-desacetyl-2-hydroxyethyl bacteriochlorophyllide A dehydrogenase